MKFTTTVPLLFAVLAATTVGYAMKETSAGTKTPGPQVAAELNIKEGVDFQVLGFPAGSSKLSAAQKRQLKALRDSASGDVDKIHVAVWSDRPFPIDEKKKIPERQQSLADKRIDVVEKYLDDELGLDGIETYSMAERSNWFARAFQTDEEDLKSLFTIQGAPADIEQEELEILRARGGPRKAVILIERK